METKLIQLLQSRKATRAIASQPLSEETITTLMEATQLSASCSNNQSWRFLFLTEPEALQKGRKTISIGNSWALTAPLLVVGFSKPDLDCQDKYGRKYYLFDLGLATQLIMLQATELNLVARPFSGFNPEIIKSEFNLPPEYEPCVMLAIGYEGNINDLDESAQVKSRNPRIRNPLDFNFFRNRFEQSIKP